MQPDQTTTLRDAVASIDFRRYVGVVLKHKWYVMGFFILIVTLGTLYTLPPAKNICRHRYGGNRNATT